MTSIDKKFMPKIATILSNTHNMDSSSL